KAAPGQIAVAIETPHGPVVETLLDHAFQVFAINPKQLDRFRDRFTVAGAKDDSRDARVLGSALRTDRQAFRRLVVDDPLVIELREWSRMADELQQERTRLANRVRQQLWRYYPQAVELTDDVADDWFLALWQPPPRYPGAAANNASRSAVWPATNGCKTPSTAGRAAPFSTIPPPCDVTTRCAGAVTATRAPCGLSAIVCSMPCAPRSSDRC